MTSQSTSSPWTQSQKDQWSKAQTLKRSYKDQVLSKIEDLKSAYNVIPYGALSIDPHKYRLFLVTSKSFNTNKKTILITGGVHGYETSGVQGALAFMKREAKHYADHFNFVCAPCVSPWAYETINRWNAKAMDPNRSFRADSPAEECSLFLKAIAPFINDIYAHFDLHETTDTDNTVFRPALAARDGKDVEEESPIPDGFYTVGDSDNPCEGFQKAIVDAVKHVTHIAPADEYGQIIGADVAQEGVINYPVKDLFLCAGVTNAKYTTTTEVYPDSPKVNDEICKDAQVAAIKGGLEFIKKSLAAEHV